MINKSLYFEIKNLAESYKAELLVVTKNQTNEDILKLYELGQRTFGENKVQKLVERYQSLPKDIKWHMIGHLQKNKIKYIIDWIDCIQSVDTYSLAVELNKAALDTQRKLPVFLEIKIAHEFTKYGFRKEELLKSLQKDPWDQLTHICISGVMGMATFTNDASQIKNEFLELKESFVLINKELRNNPYFSTLSMGMSGDYKIALEAGSTMIRIGSLLFS